MKRTPQNAGNQFSIHDRITRIPPKRIDVVHHDLDDERDEFAQEVPAVSDLIAVDGAVPGGAAMHELVSQRVKAAQHDAEHAGRIALSECLSRGLVGVGEVPGPFRLGEFAVFKIPEILIDVPVVEQ